ncbi:hypothetical protein FCL40_07340 [Ferrimonas sediminicola]|uniref:Uncharacterized protein n=1 Tax=Ferrimonas sediminicola TaxID=2569538 RepID=A0A4U1BIS9_9GAMM|nr:hypothetical protein [Ferrimonas sediminicola]TKB49956.1 hypothetical protein FCL40_07340 [Ferrimonas sediminicola]
MKKLVVAFLCSMSFYSSATIITYRCDNSCVTTIDSVTGEVVVKDCCGGRVTAVFTQEGEIPKK